MRPISRHRRAFHPVARRRATRPRLSAAMLVAALAGGLGLALAIPALLPGPAPMVEVATAEELADLFAAQGYDCDLPGAKAVAVPRILLAAVPADLDATATPAERKDLFLRLMLPLVLTVNEEIAGDRAQLVALAGLRDAGEDFSGEQADWLAALGRRYGIAAGAPDAAELDADAPDAEELVAELLRRVDIVPPSLAIAQAALESGWGTSRLAREGNALFGERTWSAAGLEPLAREAGTRHRARSFARLLDAVAAYMRNLNTHDAYGEFRRVRAGLRADGALPAGVALVGQLARYSELGDAYIKAVRGLIRSNRLQGLDRAALLPQPGSI